VKPEEIRAILCDHLSPAGAGWLDASLEQVAATPGVIRMLFPAVGRQCGRSPIGDEAADQPPRSRYADGVRGWTVDDAARVLLLARLPLAGPELAREVCDLYWYGDAAEKRGVLRALGLLDVGDAALPVVRDALRTNDTRLIAAALGPYAAAHLDDAAYRQAVLKCVFTGVPLGEVAGLAERRDAELARMFAAFARERLSAGRPVPTDVWLVTRPEEIPEEN
jgi:hypothetical protein